MKPLRIIFVFAFALLVKCTFISAQSFSIDYREFMGADSAVRFKKYWYAPPASIAVKDSSGIVRMQTEPIFSAVYCADTYCIARLFINVHHYEGEGYSLRSGEIWLCMNTDLSIRFTFPDKTMQVGILECGQHDAYLYSPIDSFEGLTYVHRGLVNNSGDVVLAPIYDWILYCGHGIVCGLEKKEDTLRCTLRGLDDGYACPDEFLYGIDTGYIYPSDYITEPPDESLFDYDSLHMYSVIRFLNNSDFDGLVCFIRQCSLPRSIMRKNIKAVQRMKKVFQLRAEQDQEQIHSSLRSSE